MVSSFKIIKIVFSIRLLLKKGLLKKKALRKKYLTHNKIELYYVYGNNGI